MTIGRGRFGRRQPEIEPLRAKVNEPASTKGKMDDVAAAVAAVKRGLSHAVEQAAGGRRRSHPLPHERPRPVDPLKPGCPPKRRVEAAGIRLPSSSRRKSCTAYDATYLALSEALDAPLITCDTKLAGIPGASASVEVIDA